MRHLQKICSKLFACLFISAFLWSCENEEHYDVLGDATNRIYMTNSGIVRNFMITHASFATVGEEVNVEISVSAIKEVEQDVRVGLSIDNSFIEKYNKQFGTTYKALPQEYIQLDKEVIIPVNSNKSTTSAKLFVSKDNYVSLKEKGGYLIPVVIGSTSSTQISSERNVVYTIIQTRQIDNNINENATVEDAKVSFLEDRSGWSNEILPADVSIDGDFSVLFDNNETVSYRSGYKLNLSGERSISMIMDLKELYEVAGVYIVRSPIKCTLYMSEDKNDWKLMGDISDKKAGAIFYVPLKAKYIKCEFQPTRSWMGVWSCFVNMAEFRIYLKNK